MVSPLTSHSPPQSPFTPTSLISYASIAILLVPSLLGLTIIPQDTPQRQQTEMPSVFLKEAYLLLLVASAQGEGF